MLKKAIMGFQPLPNYNGSRHLPLPKGKYIVGTSDLMTKTVFMRCFYPTAKELTLSDYYENSDRWPSWLPSLEYADGYMRFKFSSGSSFAARLFRWLILDPKCPSLHDAPVLKAERPLPVIVFSHGMGAMRTTYSMLLSELASQGYFVAAVEHRDGSASSTLTCDGSWMYERKLQPDEDEYSLRNGQVKQRVQECEMAFGLLAKMGKKDVSDEEWGAQYKPTDQFIASADHLDLDNGCYVSGHSFGSATALRALYTSKLANGNPMFKRAVLYDAWMFPLRKEADELTVNGVKSEALFVNCQKFQGLKNLETMHAFETNIDEMSNVLTLRDAMHYAPTDIPTVFLGSWARLPFSWLFRMSSSDPSPTSGEGPAPLPASKSVEVCSELGLRFLSNNLKTYVEKIQRFVIHGTDYIKK